MAKRPPVSRLLVSPEVAREVEDLRIEILVRTRQERTKTAVHDAIIRVGLRHLDEVAAELTGSPEEDTPDE